MKFGFVNVGSQEWTRWLHHAIRRAAEERMRRFLGRRDPVAAWSFEKLSAGRFADDSGNGFFAKIVGGAEPADAGRSGLLGAGSRVRNRLLLAGEP